MSFSRFLRAGLIAASLFGLSQPANASVVTYTFTGTIDSSYFIVGTGAFTGLFNIGDSYTLTGQIDLGPAPDLILDSAGNTDRRWYSGNVQTMQINGQTFSVGDAVVGFDDRI